MKPAGSALWWYSASVLIMLFTLLPLYLMLKISISPPQEVFTPHPSFGLHAITAAHWRAMLTSDALWPPLGKSLAVATWTMLGAIGLAAPAAYVMSRLPTAWRYALL